MQKRRLYGAVCSRSDELKEECPRPKGDKGMSEEQAKSRATTLGISAWRKEMKKNLLFTSTICLCSVYIIASNCDATFSKM